MSNYAAGVVILGLADLLLFLFGLMVHRSNAVRSRRGLPSSYALGLAAGALLGHFVALYFAAALTQDKFTVLALTCLFGIFPASIFALIVRDSFSDRAINLIMGSEDALDRVDLSKAREYAVRGDLENARRAYQTFARQYPNSPDPLFGLESTYALDQRYEEAAGVCRDILRRFRSDPDTRRRAASRLAELLEEHLDNPEGAAAARADAEAAGNAGRTPVKGEREQRAAGAVGIKPKEDRFTIETARRLVRQGKIDGAIAAYETLYERNPEHPRPLFESATALENAGRYERALDSLRRVAREFSESPDHWGASTLRQASIHQNKLDDVDTARRLLMLVQERLPGTEQARVAIDRLSVLPTNAD